MTNRLLKLLASNRKRGCGIAQRASDDTTVYVYDVIVATDIEAEFFGGISAESFVKTLRSMTADKIHVRINSPGGDVFGGRAMEQAMREHAAEIIVHIDGYAASAATFLAMAADRVEIAPGGFFMIHKAWTMAIGNADELLARAALLEKIDAGLAESYAARTGRDIATITKMMAAETWFSAAEAVDFGFADTIAEGNKAKNEAGWDVSAYEHAPAVVEPEPETREERAIGNLQRRLRLAEQAA